MIILSFEVVPKDLSINIRVIQKNKNNQILLRTLSFCSFSPKTYTRKILGLYVNIFMSRKAHGFYTYFLGINKLQIYCMQPIKTHYV